MDANQPTGAAAAAAAEGLEPNRPVQVTRAALGFPAGQVDQPTTAGWTGMMLAGGYRLEHEPKTEGELAQLVEGFMAGRTPNVLETEASEAIYAEVATTIGHTQAGWADVTTVVDVYSLPPSGAPTATDGPATTGDVA